MNKIFRLCESYAPLIGRILIGVLFVYAGYGKIQGGLTEGVNMIAGYIASVGLPFPTILAILTIVLELFGGIAIILGFKTRLVALLLTGFMVLVTYFFAIDFSSQMATGNFLNHLVIIGGLLYITAFGPGHFSVDKR